MVAYVRYRVSDFLTANATTVVGALEQRYAGDGFSTQYTQQTKAWSQFIPLLQAELSALVLEFPQAANWGLLLEYPLYRLRRRIDAVLLASDTVVVLEAKVGETNFHSVDERQAEDYALDLRDFHAGCRSRAIVPVLWCTKALLAAEPTSANPADHVWPVERVGTTGLKRVLQRFTSTSNGPQLDLVEWDAAPYQPVPTIVQAATSIFAGNDVREISRADATNLAVSARRIVELIGEAKRENRKAIIFLTGVPGSGKTLAGLQVVHDAIASGTEDRGDVVYLSGNTPLVTVLREALALDTVDRRKREGNPSTLRAERRVVRTRIQHIIDFLRQYLGQSETCPHEHAIVFDEAQRAWDAEQGKKKFGRQKSEPSILLDILGRHIDWCACVCLVGGGQEINTGEEGIQGWGDALRDLPAGGTGWSVYGPDDVFQGGISTGSLSLGELPLEITTVREADLRLTVPLRSYRSPALCEWVSAVLEGDLESACQQAEVLRAYPILLTRSFRTAKRWLREKSRGHRRYGLLASSGARRLRANGVGEMLKAKDGQAIAHWYLKGRGDIRSSFALEVPANEYACQGLEIDFACVCWGGDLVFSSREGNWSRRALSGNAWQIARRPEDRRHIQNTYRVLLTRAREGLVIWVPRGSRFDATRNPTDLDATAEFLVAAGAQPLPDLRD